MVVVRRVLAIALFVSACRSPGASPSPGVPDAAPAAAASLAEAATDAASASAPAPSATAASGRLAVVRAWNDALSAHDLDALGKAYASRVKLYGSEMARAAALAQKREQYAKNPRYRQSILNDAVRFEDQSDGRVRATFVKLTHGVAKARAYAAYLVLAPEDGALRVVEESDDTTDANRAKGCEDAVVAAAMATPAAKAFFDTPVPPEATDAGFISRGAMVYPRSSGETRYSVALHDNFEDHISNQVWLEVDPATGAVYADGARASTAPAVVRACK